MMMPAVFLCCQMLRLVWLLLICRGYVICYERLLEEVRCRFLFFLSTGRRLIGSLTKSSFVCEVGQWGGRTREKRVGK